MLLKVLQQHEEILLTVLTIHISGLQGSTANPKPFQFTRT